MSISVKFETAMEEVFLSFLFYFCQKFIFCLITRKTSDNFEFLINFLVLFVDFFFNRLDFNDFFFETSFAVFKFSHFFVEHSFTFCQTILYLLQFFAAVFFFFFYFFEYFDRFFLCCEDDFLFFDLGISQFFFSQSFDRVGHFLCLGFSYIVSDPKSESSGNNSGNNHLHKKKLQNLQEFICAQCFLRSCERGNRLLSKMQQRKQL